MTVELLGFICCLAKHVFTLFSRHASDIQPEVQRMPKTVKGLLANGTVTFAVGARCARHLDASSAEDNLEGIRQ